MTASSIIATPTTAKSPWLSQCKQLKGTDAKAQSVIQNCLRRTVATSGHDVSLAKGFYGPGSKFKIDTTKPVPATTQFIIADGIKLLAS